jgi:hypothetical protein
MIQKFLGLQVLILTSLSAVAQNTNVISHDLKIYSESGDKFKLIVQGDTINKDFATQVTYPTNLKWFKAKLIFETATLEPLEKTIQVVYFEERYPVGSSFQTIYKLFRKKDSARLKVESTTLKATPQNGNGSTIIINNAQPEPQNGVNIKVGRSSIGF